ncbi:MAG: hypothetical protein RIR96_231 [Bacteroidota bacterium]
MLRSTLFRLQTFCRKLISEKSQINLKTGSALTRIPKKDRNTSKHIPRKKEEPTNQCYQLNHGIISPNNDLIKKAEKNFSAFLLNYNFLFNDDFSCFIHFRTKTSDPVNPWSNLVFQIDGLSR